MKQRLQDEVDRNQLETYRGRKEMACRIQNKEENDETAPVSGDSEIASLLGDSIKEA